MLLVYRAGPGPGDGDRFARRHLPHVAEAEALMREELAAEKQDKP